MQKPLKIYRYYVLSRWKVLQLLGKPQPSKFASSFAGKIVCLMNFSVIGSEYQFKHLDRRYTLELQPWSGATRRYVGEQKFLLVHDKLMCFAAFQ